MDHEKINFREAVWIGDSKARLEVDLIKKRLKMAQELEENYEQKD